MPMVFQCQHAECSRSYKRREHLLRHQKVHANLRSFACQVCPASFNRRDLLNRHNIKCQNTLQRKHEVSLPASFVQPEPKRGVANDLESDSHANHDRACERLALGLGKSILIALGAEIAQVSNRNVLEQHYFRELHPHWPILHRDTFQSKPQPEELVQAVLVAGLWMSDTAKMRQLAERYLDMLIEIQLFNFYKFDPPSDLLKSPRPEYLALFQTLMITIIVSTYRGINSSPLAIADNKRLLRLTVLSKRLFRLFEHAGVFDQKMIDIENPLNPIAQEQYQRIALCLFKAFVHLNALLITHLPNFKLLDYFPPAKLNVRVPSPYIIWNASTNYYLQGVDERTLIGRLFINDAKIPTYQVLGLISAWDFSTGMILGCFLKVQPFEPLLGLISRLRPFLFWNLNLEGRKGCVL